LAGRGQGAPRLANLDEATRRRKYAVHNSNGSGRERQVPGWTHYEWPDGAHFAAQLRVGGSIFGRILFPVYIGVPFGAGLFLREREMRAFFPRRVGFAVPDGGNLMEPGESTMRVLKGILAVLAGILADVILSIGTDALLHAAGITPALGQRFPDHLLLLATAYRAVYGVAGGYLTARLAPDRPLQHALAGGFLGLVLGILGAALTWNKGAEFGPHWYPVALIVLALPCAWVGGALGRGKPSGG